MGGEVMPKSKRQALITVWVSALVPTNGADCYDGIRLCVFLSEQAAYTDLAEWLETDVRTIPGIIDELNDSSQVSSWNVEEQTIHGLIAELKTARKRAAHA